MPEEGRSPRGWGDYPMVALGTVSGAVAMKMWIEMLSELRGLQGQGAETQCLPAQQPRC